MLILALDTTTRTGSCAVARDGVVVLEAGSDTSRPPAARLPADLMALLDAAGLALDAIDVFAVATGPGSFTGLRIGIATMQGLAFAAGKPLIGISGFDALALLAGIGRVVPFVDAWRGEVYAARYDDGRQTVAPVVQRPEPLIAEWAGQGARDSVTFIGDGAETYRSLIEATPGARVATPATPLLAGAIARLAYAEAVGGARPAPHAIRPLYVRRPDAELARDRA